MVVFQELDPIGEAERHRQLDLILILVRTVASALLGFPILDVGQGGISDDFSYIVGQTVFIAEGFLCKAAVLLFHPQQEGQPLIDHRLLFKYIPKIIGWDVDVGKDLQVRLPTLAASGLFFVGRLLFQPTDVLSLFKMEIVAISVPINFRIKILRGILCRTGTQSVESQ